MTIETMIILVLVLLLIGQQCFYMWQTQKLLNKIMSRNYVEYAQVNSSLGPKPEQGFRVQLPDPTEDQRIKELNQMMGLS
jgi:hypothetical protein